MDIQPIATVIVGATDVVPQKPPGIYFLIGFSDGKQKLIRREEAHKLCPQLLIDFYESHMVWNPQEPLVFADLAQ